MAASKVRSQQQLAGNRYSGQLLRQIRHGEGEYMYTNTFFKYKGMWVNGVKHGKRAYIYEIAILRIFIYVFG
jgi:hypothetical protein